MVFVTTQFFPHLFVVSVVSAGCIKSIPSKTIPVQAAGAENDAVPRMHNVSAQPEAIKHSSYLPCGSNVGPGLALHARIVISRVGGRWANRTRGKRGGGNGFLSVSAHFTVKNGGPAQVKYAEGPASEWSIFGEMGRGINV